LIIYTKKFFISIFKIKIEKLKRGLKFMKNKKNLLIIVGIIILIIVFIVKDNFFQENFETITSNNVTLNISEETKNTDDDMIKVHIYRRS
jgi:preprotein translocase subunit SecF